MIFENRVVQRGNVVSPSNRPIQKIILMKKIVFLSHVDMNLYLFRRPIMRQLVERGWQVTALAPSGDYSERFAADGVKHVSYPIRPGGMNPLQELLVVFRLWRILRRLGPDIVHTFTMKPNLYGTLAARLAGVPCIANSVTGLGSFFLDEDNSSVTRKMLLAFYRLAGCFNSTTIFQNEDDLSFFLEQKLVSSAKWNLIKGSGVDLQRFDPARFGAPEQAAMRTKLDIPHDNLVVICIARLLKDKGVVEFCDAARMVHGERGRTTTFLLVGDFYGGNPSNLPHSYIEGLVAAGVIRFLGWRGDIPELLSISDLVVLPSYREGLPVSLQEALSMGLPVVTTDAPGCREVVDDGVNGLLVPVRDARAVAIAIGKLLANQRLREQMGKASLHKARTEFDAWRIAEAHIQLYESLLRGVPERRRALWPKRFFDLSLVLLFLPLALPVLVVLAFLVRFNLGSPVLFRQERPGLYGRPFIIYKFRTMTNGRDKNGALLPDQERLTAFGRFLRSTSLDELPELLNVLLGDMSLVGPRPLLLEYLDRYDDLQFRRHETLPGITGLAQVRGRNAISWEEKFTHDVWYVDHRSLWLDIKILWKTAMAVFKQQGITQEGLATTDKFMGSPSPHAEKNPATRNP